MILEYVIKKHKERAILDTINKVIIKSANTFLVFVIWG